MIFNGIQKTSLVNYPDNISLVLFTGGCNLNCRYCYNRDLVYTSSNSDEISEDEALFIIKKRISFIDAVVVTGGEPTIQKDLHLFLRRVKQESGLLVKLDTNGFNPDMLQVLINDSLIDYTAIDIKTSPDKYSSLVDTDVDISLLKKSLSILKNSNVSYELRSTIVPGYFDDLDIASIEKFTGHVPAYNIQQYVNEATLDNSFTDIHPIPKDLLFKLQERILEFADSCTIRGI